MGGKSTLMLIMSLLIKTSSAHMITEKDTNEESQIIISADGKTDKWERNASNKMTTGKYKERRMIASAHYHGFYEGSIFYGSRFYDYQKINDFFADPNYKDKLVDADPFVSETFGLILHNDKQRYKN